MQKCFKLLILSFLSATFFFPDLGKTQCDTLVWQWANAGPSATNEQKWIWDVDSDHLGNMLFTGNYEDFFWLTGMRTTLTANNREIVFGKVDSLGNEIWLQSLGGSQSDRGLGIAANSTGDIFLTGFFQGSMTLGSVTLNAVGSSDVFVAKFNSSGELIWANSFGSPLADEGAGVSPDSQGGCFVAGYISGNTKFGSDVINGKGGEDAFVARLDSTGNVVWAKVMGGVGNDEAIAIVSTTDGGTAICGDYQGSADFEGTSFNGIGPKDIFLAKYDINGNQEWALSPVGEGLESPRCITTDQDGNIIFGGQVFESNVTFGTSTVISSIGGADPFVAKYDSNGVFQWVRKGSGPSRNEVTYGITADLDGNIIITGDIDGQVSFGAFTLVSRGNRDNFIVKYSPQGEELFANSYGSFNLNDVGISLAVSPKNEIYAAGIYTETYALDSVILPSVPGSYGTYIGKLKLECDTGVPTGIQKPPVQEAKGLSVYPNPNNGAFTVAINTEYAGTANLEIYDARGAKVWRESRDLIIGANLLRVDAELPDGLYILKMTSKDRKQVVKLVIE